MYKQFNPLISPDGFRKALQLLKSFYGLHTKKNYGYKDINGSQYSGIVENYGMELLLEARKLLMDRPSLDDLFINNTFTFYFNIGYSDVIDTYDQQNMLVATLSKDVFLSNKTYRIRFDNCINETILRSDSWSDPIVKRNTFVHTTTPPTLIIDDGVDIEEIPLILNNNDNTDYYFYINTLTSPYVESNIGGTLTTIPLTDKMFDLPFIWMCVDIFRLLPDINFVNNVDMSGKRLLNIGTDGHDITKLYPLVYGLENLPSTYDGNWYIKVKAKEGGSFVNTGNVGNNYNVIIDTISFINTTAIGITPLSETTITFDDEYTKMTLSGEVNWLFKTPITGDYDYDGTTYINDCYAYISIDSFLQNINPTSNLLSAFIVQFSEDYLHDYELALENAVSGIHIDASSDYSDNSIMKKNGLMHDLGDFDGLPKYFKYMLSKTLHHAHVELYSIRDDLNNRNQHVTDKQVATLVLDSAVPQNEIIDIDSDLNTVITYDMTQPRTYMTIDESISPRNSLSEITYIDDNTFSNVNIYGQQNNQRFIYHGNRVFSIGMLAYDPELEIARVYVISNDGVEYDNNERSQYIKPERCMCRICDIPTSFVQLSKIEGKSPTLVIDEKYVRMNVPFTVNEKDMIWNECLPRLVTKPNGLYVFDNDDNLDDILSKEYLSENHSRMGNLSASLDMTTGSENDDYEFDIFESGNGYNVNDKFAFIIGGIYFSGIVTSVDMVDGEVTGFDILPNIDATINVGNFDDKIVKYQTTPIVGNGSGLVVKLTIDDIVWESLQPTLLSIYPDLYAYKFDHSHNIWVWKYNISEETWYSDSQLTGPDVVENVYDDYNTQSKRPTLDVYMKNSLINNRVIDKSAWFSPLNTESLDIRIQQSSISSEIDIHSGFDLSNMITGINTQNTYYTLIDSENFGQNHDVFIYETYSPYWVGKVANEYVLPKFHELNLSSYYNKSNIISYTYTVIGNRDKQPTLCIYNPIQETLSSYNTISTDIVEKVSSRELTFVDILKPTDRLPDLLDTDTGILNDNVYVYNETSLSEDMIILKSTLVNMSRDDLVQYIFDDFGEDALPLQYEDTEYEYSKQMLIDYIILNSYNDPVYQNNDIRLLRSKNEQVVDIVNGKYIGIGEQPTGGYQSISTEIFNPNVLVDNVDDRCDMLFVFQIPSDTSISSLNGFLLKDDDGNDISSNTLLIYRNKKYIYADSWVEI